VRERIRGPRAGRGCDARGRERAAGLREAGDRALQVPATRRIHGVVAADGDGQAAAVSPSRGEIVTARVAINPSGWKAPSGYAHGVAATGRIIVTAGQIGWNPRTAQFESDDFAEQTAQALRN